MQILNESRIESTQKILYQYIEHELSILSAAGQHLEVIRQALQQIDGHADSQLFIKYNKKEWIDPPDFAFEPCSAWEDTVSFINHSYRFSLPKFLKSSQLFFDRQNLPP